MPGSRLSIVLLFASLVGSTAIDAAGQVTAEAVNTKIALMEKVINSLVQRSQQAENKLHTVETQLNDVKARDEKLDTQLKSLLEKDAIITTQMQQANEQIQKLQQDKTLLTQANTKLQVLERQLQLQTTSWKEVKESEATLKAHQSVLSARQDNQATILKNVESKQADILNKQNIVENQLKNQEIQLANQKNTQIQFGNKQAEIVNQQTILIGEVTNHARALATQQQAIQNVTQRQVLIETDFAMRLNVMGKHVNESEFRLTKLEDSEKKLTNTIQTHETMASQKYSDISLKQVRFELAINNFSSDLSGLLQNSAVIQAKQSLSDRKIQDLGLKQQVLDQLVVAQAGHIKKLDSKALTNLQQVTWTKDDGTDNGVLKTFSFIKKNAESGLRVSFYGNMRVYGSGVRCNRWWFEINGSECTNPAKIDGLIRANNPIDNYFTPNVVSGICSGIPAGNVNVVFKVGNCNNGVSLGDAHTGYFSTSRIIVEEL